MACRSICLSLVLILSGLYAQSQPVPELPAVDLARTGILDNISTKCSVWFSDSRSLTPADLPSLPFILGTTKFDHYIPASLINKEAILKFTLLNSSDSLQRAFLCPGFFFDSIRLYQLDSSDGKATVREAPLVMPEDKDSLGYRGISLQPHETRTFFVQLSFIRAPTNSLNPTLTREVYIKKGIVLNHRNKTDIDIITNLFAGIMLMMIFYGVSEYLQTAKPEFLYYAGYCFCISTLLFLKSILHNTTTPFNFFFEGFFDNVIFCLGHISYIVFHRKFLETRKNYRSLDRYLFWGACAIGAGLMMTLRTMLPDVFGVGFLLAGGGGLAIWGVGYGARHLSRSRASND